MKRINPFENLSTATLSNNKEQVNTIKNNNIDTPTIITNVKNLFTKTEKEKKL